MKDWKRWYKEETRKDVEISWENSHETECVWTTCDYIWVLLYVMCGFPSWTLVRFSFSSTVTVLCCYSLLIVKSALKLNITIIKPYRTNGLFNAFVYYFCIIFSLHTSAVFSVLKYIGLAALVVYWEGMRNKAQCYKHVRSATPMPCFNITSVLPLNCFSYPHGLWGTNLLKWRVIIKYSSHIMYLVENCATHVSCAFFIL